jgi:hypothetical protein
MRTLNRPMFNMGGPIKQGIMHGIREPHVRGQIVGKTIQYGKQAMPHIRRAGRTFRDWASRTFGSTGPVTGKTTTQQVGPWTTGPFQSTQKIIGDTKQVWTPKGWVARDPIYRVGRQVVENRGMLGKPITWTAKQIATPTGVGLTGWGAYSYLKGDKKPDPGDAVTGIEKPGGYPPGKGKGTGTDTTTNAAAFAKAQREERLNKYLQMMGYDQSKKTAIADALIDASKIVSDRGTLDRKNITGELINPAIQAFSKRLDKPQQIREAVGLMAAKAEIEKDLNKEKDALANRLTKSRIAVQEATLDQDNLGGDVKAHFLKQGKLPKGDDLATYARMRGIEVAGVPSTVEVEKWMKSNKKDEVDYLKELKVGPGIYVVSDRILVIDENNNIQSVL